MYEKSCQIREFFSTHKTDMADTCLGKDLTSVEILIELFLFCEFIFNEKTQLIVIQEL